MRLNQVLINLGSNAIKFTAAGEVVVSVHVIARHERRCRSCRFAVRDTGIGIAPENQARIFSGFTQGEASTTRRFGGTGLGVSISQRLVELMGGDLMIDSALGQGSCFHFRISLPLRGRSLPPKCVQTAEAPAAARAGHRRQRDRARRAGAHGRNRWAGRSTLPPSGGQRARDAAATRPQRGARLPGGLRRLADAGHRRLGDQPAHPRTRARRRGAGGRDGDRAWPRDAEILREHRRAGADRPLSGQAGHRVDAVRCGGRRARAEHAAAASVARVADRRGRSGSPGCGCWSSRTTSNNQQIARELLEAEGAPVQIAVDGQQGVEAIAAAAAAVRPGVDGLADAGAGRLCSDQPDPSGSAAAEPADRRDDGQCDGLGPRSLHRGRDERPRRQAVRPRSPGGRDPAACRAFAPGGRGNRWRRCLAGRGARSGGHCGDRHRCGGRPPGWTPRSVRAHAACLRHRPHGDGRTACRRAQWNSSRCGDSAAPDAHAQGSGGHLRGHRAGGATRRRRNVLSATIARRTTCV